MVPNPPPACFKGELDYSEFLEVMTETLHRLAEDKAKSNGAQIPFALMVGRVEWACPCTEDKQYLPGR